MHEVNREKNDFICNFCKRPEARHNPSTHSYRVHQGNTAKTHWYHNAYCNEQCENWYQQHLEEERWRDPDYINKWVKENPNGYLRQSNDPGLLIDRLRKQGVKI